MIFRSPIEFLDRMAHSPARLNALSTSRSRVISQSALVLLVLAMAGCSNQVLPTYPVQGQLKYEDGSVPMFGDIEFYNADHQLNARGKIRRDGSFTVGTFQENDGAVAGKHKIVIMQHMVSPLVARHRAEMSTHHDHGKLLSNHYFDYRTSDLECEIVPGENQIELVLKLNPKQTEDGLPSK